MTTPLLLRNSNVTVASVSIVFFLLSLWGVLNHELWLDEAHHYVLARDSVSFKDLLQNTRYEGHPIVWNLILYCLTRCTTDPIWMQVVHIFISTLSIVVFLKKAPFSWGFKLLFIFGYFMFFEYNILSRNYSLGILFTFLAMSLYPKRNSKFLSIAILLGIAANSHAIFLILAASIMAFITIERFTKRAHFVSKYAWLGILLFGLLTALSLIQIIPPSDTSFFERSESLSAMDAIAKGMSPLFKSLFYFPDVTLHSFWNSHILVNYNKSIASVFALVSLGIPFVLFYKNKGLLLYMYFGIIATAGLIILIQMNAARYYGVLFLLLITALWFDRYANTSSYRDIKLFNKLKPILVYTILSLHFISGVFAFSKEISTPFTTSKQTAAYLVQKNLISKKIVTTACNGTALSSYIKKPIFFTSTGQYQSFCLFNQPQSQQSQKPDAVLTVLKKFLKTNKESFIFITHSPFLDAGLHHTGSQQHKGLLIQFITKFDGSIIKKGNHYMYAISAI